MTLGCAAALALGACNSSGTPSGGGTLSSPIATPTVTVTATATATVTKTVTPKPAQTHTSFTTPKAAAEHLYNAWKNDDRPGALQGATKYAVDSLFATGWVDNTYFFGGCTQNSGPSECDYNTSSGAYRMMIIPAPGGGYLVDELLIGNAG